MTQNTHILNEETVVDNEASLVFHKIVSMLDHGHVDFEENAIRFNVGALIKKSSYNNLGVLIRKGANTSPRIGKHRSKGHIYIVMETDTLPDRKKIDSFLERPSIAKSFLKAFGEYLSKFHEETDDNHKTKEELEDSVNSVEKFEEIYKEVVANVDEAIKEYEKTKGESASVFAKYNVAKMETQKLSLGILQGEFFGNNEDEFAAKFLKSVPAANHLQKEFKDKMLSRLRSLYVSKIKHGL